MSRKSDAALASLAEQLHKVAAQVTTLQGFENDRQQRDFQAGHVHDWHYAIEQRPAGYLYLWWCGHPRCIESKDKWGTCHAVITVDELPDHWPEGFHFS